MWFFNSDCGHLRFSKSSGHDRENAEAQKGDEPEYHDEEKYPGDLAHFASVSKLQSALIAAISIGTGKLVQHGKRPTYDADNSEWIHRVSLATSVNIV